MGGASKASEGVSSAAWQSTCMHGGGKTQKSVAAWASRCFNGAHCPSQPALSPLPSNPQVAELRTELQTSKVHGLGQGGRCWWRNPSCRPSASLLRVFS